MNVIRRVLEWRNLVFGLVVVALSGMSATARIDQALTAAHLPGASAGGVGTLANLARLTTPATASGVAAAWREYRAVDEGLVERLTCTYLVTDLFLMLAVTSLLVLWRRWLTGRVGPLPVGRRRLLNWPIPVYLAFDLAETIMACTAWDGGYGTGFAMGVAGCSLVKWLALGVAVTGLAVASVATVAEGARPKQLRLVAHTLLAYRAQLLMVLVLLGTFLLLRGDLGLQVDDVLVWTAESLPRLLAATVVAVGTGVAIARTGSWCAKAYEEADPSGTLKAWVGLMISLVLAVGLAALGFVLGSERVGRDEWSAVPYSLAVPAGVAALYFLLSLPATPVPESTATEGEDPIRASPLLLRYVSVAPVLILLLAVVRTITTQLSEDLVPGLMLWAFLLLLATVVLFVFAPTKAWTGPIDRGRVLRALLPATAALVLGAFLPIDLWLNIGTPTVIYLWATLATLLLAGLVVLSDLVAARGILTLIGLRRTPLITLLLVWFLVAGTVDARGAYYDVRVLEGEPAAAIRPSAAYQAWLEAHKDEDEVPLVFVAAAGGGIRAAYWTTASWRCSIGNACRDGADRTADVFLASGVSGGSLGLVKVGTPPAERTELVSGLRKDFVAPAVAGFLFRDLPNSILRLPVGEDRADVLEQAWEAEDARLADPFYPAKKQQTFPHLVLNGTGVEDACRLSVSTLTFERDPGHPTPPDPAIGSTECQAVPGSDLRPTAPTRDARQHLCTAPGKKANVRRSTAALLSARFPFVSPAGALAGCGKKMETHVLDGGIIENSGAIPISQTWRAIAEEVAKTNRHRGKPCVVPRLLVLDNGYANTAALEDIARPLQTQAAISAALRFFGNRSNRELGVAVETIAAAAEATADTCHHAGKGRPDVSAPVVVIHPQARPGTQAPLGWTLSSASITDLGRQLRGEDGDCTGDEGDSVTNCVEVRSVWAWWRSPAAGP